MIHCKTTFTLVHNDVPFMNRTEVYEMVFELEEGQSMFEGLNAYLNQANNETEKKSPIITGKH